MPTFADYSAHGWKLCGISSGKGPTYDDWNTKPIPDDAVAGLTGAGLLHALSGTCALDVDDIEPARRWLAERGVDLDALLVADDAVCISSGRPGRAKLLYALKRPLRTLKPEGSGLELRCATANGASVQDVLPPSIHPTTKKPYEWNLGLLADWRTLPTIPSALLAAWRAEAAPLEAPAESEPPPAAAPDVARLRALLAPHDPDAPYDKWLQAGMAVHYETGGSSTGLAVWDEWSKRGKKYKGVADLRTHWASFQSRPGKRVITGASLEVERPASADEFPDPEPETDIVEIHPEPEGRTPRVAASLGLQRTRSGEIKSNAHNAEIMTRNLLQNMTIQFDEFLDRKLVQWPDDPEPHAWERIDTIYLQIVLQSRGLQEMSLENARSAAEVIAREQRTNCVTAWLDSIEPQWDHTDRLRSMMVNLFGTPDDEYHQVAGVNWLVGLCARAYRPGCLVREVLVLEGEQYLGKSAALRMLVNGPNDDKVPSWRKWYKELTANPESKDFEHQLRGVWLGEFPELHSIQRGEVERLKQFISNTEDHYRPPYAEDNRDYPRRCVLIGTTNRTDWNRDETGGSRYMPISCAKVDLAWLEANRIQLFAEAVHRFKAGEKWHIWPRDVAQQMQQARAAGDPWEEVIERNWRDAARGHHDVKFVTANGILSDVLGIQPSAQTTSLLVRTASVLKRLGFTPLSRRRINGVRENPWLPPEDNHDPLLD